MGKLTGTVLLLAGVTLAASQMPSRPDKPGVVAAPRAGGKIEATARPAPPDLPKAEAKQADAAPAMSQAIPPQPPAPALAPPPEDTVTAPPEKAAEPKPHPAVPPPALRIIEAPPRVPIDQSEAASSPPLDRAGLTREIQRQLKRVGCYRGAVTGVWSTSVRQAMKSFTDRINATLPVDEPDQVLLAMVRSHQDVVCTASCPKGQGIGRDGRCVPDALIARTGKQPSRKTPAPAKQPDDGNRPAGPSAVAAPAAQPLPDGRMSLAGPRTEPAISAKAPNGNPRARNQIRQARPARPPRYAETPARQRRYEYRSHSAPPGFPWWALPAFTP